MCEECCKSNSQAAGCEHNICIKSDEWDTHWSTGHASGEHTHVYTSYSRDASGHWQVCKVSDCRERTATEAHTFGPWRISRPATETSTGLKSRLCTVCEYWETEDIITYYTRVDDTYVFRGNFPCDKNGAPIMRWTTIRVQNEASIEFSGEKSRCGELRILLGPKTKIHIREFYETEDDDAEVDGTSDEFMEEPLMWRQIYAGPQTIEFNHNALKQARIEHKLKQSDVALAIGTSVRTYQKWESGETIPDGHNLLRLMNWLNISDPQDLIIYEDYPDE